jgi:glycerol-3-phosphate O-acyltransferase
MEKKEKKKNRPARTGRVRAFLNKILNGTHLHYSCFLPGDARSFSAVAMRSFFSGVTVSESQKSVVRDLPPDAVVVYVTKDKNNLEYLFSHFRYQTEGIAFPEIGLDYKTFLWQPVSRIFKMMLAGLAYLKAMKSLPDPYKTGYIKDALLGGRSGMLSLIEKKGFRRRFVKKRVDPVQYLLETQQNTDRPIFLVPQLMFFSKMAPHDTPKLLDILLGTEEKPGRIKKAVAIFKNPGKIFVEMSDPVSLKEFISRGRNRDKSPQSQAIALRQELLDILNHHRQAITGPVIKSKAELKELVLTSPHLRKFMASHSETYDLSMRDILGKADGHLDEIAANYKAATVKLGNVGVKWIFDAMFEGISLNRDVLERVKKMSLKGPVVLIPCHKSHIDYLVMSHIMYSQNMPCPHIAAGVNLSFWPLGAFFRTGGAFFLRRTFKGDPLYSKVFAQYIHTLLNEGFPIEFFIEGGRSRTGKLLGPKLGFLSILLDAYKSGACPDLIFAPVFVGYDRVLEEKAYVREIEGEEKESENLSQVIKARKFLKKKYGRIYIKFHEPISLNEFLAEKSLSLKQMSPETFHSFCSDFGHRVITAIDSVAVVTPHAVVAAALLNCEKKRFSADRLQSHIDTYMSYLMAQSVNLSDTLLISPSHATARAVDEYADRKFIERHIPGGGDKDGEPQQARFVVNPAKRGILDYYKNNCVSCFIPAAYTALAILEKDSFQFSTDGMAGKWDFLQDLFQREFFLEPDRSSESFMGANLKIFMEEGILSPHASMPDSYQITSEGFRKLRLFAGFVMTYFESYLIALRYLAKAPEKQVKTRDALKKISTLGNRMYKTDQIERPEALSDINYKNALAFFASQGIESEKDAEKNSFYETRIKLYINLL